MNPITLIVQFRVKQESKQEFIAGQMPKEYRSGYEKKLTALNVERSAAFYDTAAEWKSTT